MIDWESSENRILLNPCLPKEEKKEIEQAVSKLDLADHFFISTSGSTGQRKLVALGKEAVLDSARSVNEWVQAKKEDIWFQVLPDFHVGGLGVWARAWLSQSSVAEISFSQRRWSPQEFVEQVEGQKATLGSLVPTQVYDLVQRGLRSPKSLRAVFIGGGALGEELYIQARSLGWPLLLTYGFSEAGSQVATSSLDSLSVKGYPKMKVLPHIKIRSLGEETHIQGSSLLTGYLQKSEKVWEFIDPKKEGWFTLSDRIELDGESLSFLGRKDSFVKVNGENVNMDHLNQIWSEIYTHSSTCLIAQEDERCGNAVTLVSEEKIESSLIEKFNSQVMPFERIQKAVVIEKIPRSELGKVLAKELSIQLRCGRLSTLI